MSIWRGANNPNHLPLPSLRAERGVHPERTGGALGTLPLVERDPLSWPTPRMPARSAGGRAVRQPAARRTEAADYEQRLRELTEQLLRAEQRERQRLSMDLHDGLSQTIVLVKMKLSALRKSTDPRQAKTVLEIEKLVDQAHLDARTLTSELHAPALREMELVDAVNELAKRVGARYGLEIAVVDDGLAKHVETRAREVLLRSIRELLINAAKHARASRIEIRMERGERSLRVSVEDNGVGMQSQPAESPLGGGFGLTSIRECLRQIDGTLHIDSAPSRGTTVSLWTPLSKEHARVAR